MDTKKTFTKDEYTVLKNEEKILCEKRLDKSLVAQAICDEFGFAYQEDISEKIKSKKNTFFYDCYKITIPIEEMDNFFMYQMI